MKIRRLLLTGATFATLFSLTSCGDKDVVVTLHNGENDEALTIKATNDSKEVANAIRAMHYTAYLNKEKTIDITKAKISLNTSVLAKEKEDYYAKANVVLQYALPKADSVTTIQDLASGIKLYASVDAEVKLPNDANFIKGLPLTQCKLNASLYSDDTKLYVGAKGNATLRGITTNTDVKGFLNKNQIINTILSSDTVGSTIQLNMANYANVYNELRTYNFYNIICEQNQAEEQPSTGINYVDLDQFIHTITEDDEVGLEEVVKQLGVEISDAKNGKITFTADFEKIAQLSGVKLDNVSGKLAATVDVDTIAVSNVHFELNYKADTTNSTNLLKECSLNFDMSVEYGVDVPELSNKEEYTLDLVTYINGLLK